MNLGTILAEVYRRCGYASSPATDVTTRITAFINETQNELFSEPGLSGLLNDQVTLASVANQYEYGLPQTVQEIKVFTDRTNRLNLKRMSLHDYRQRFPDPTTDTGTPAYYVPMGRSMTTIYPTVALGQLNVISTSASDTNIAYLEGMRAGTPGIRFSAQVTMTGATLASIGAADVTRITKFWLSAAAVGEVSLRVGTTVVSNIAIGSSVPFTYGIALAPTPSSAITYMIDYERSMTEMFVSTDEPLLPYQFHRLLAIGARMKEYEKQDQMQRYMAANADFIKGKKQLKHWVHMQMVGSPNLRGNTLYSGLNSAVNVTTS